MPGCSWARLNSGLVKVTRLHMDTVITNNGKMKQRRICQREMAGRRNAAVTSSHLEVLAALSTSVAT